MKTINFGVGGKHQAINCLHDCILAEFIPKFEAEVRTLTLKARSNGIRYVYDGIKYRQYQFRLSDLRTEWNGKKPSGRIAILPNLEPEQVNTLVRMDELLNLSQIVMLYLNKLLKVANVPKDIERLNLIINSYVDTIKIAELPEGNMWKLEPISESRVEGFKSDPEVVSLVDKINQELLVQRMMWS